MVIPSVSMYLNFKLNLENMKKILLIFLQFISLTALTQNTDVEKNIVKKWKFDLEAMNPIYKKIIEESPQYKNLDDNNKLVAVSTALEQISNDTLEFTKEGTYINIDPKVITRGIWKINESGEELILQKADKPEKRFKIIELNETKLHIKTREGIELVYKPAN